jgi:hypothetical protein
MNPKSEKGRRSRPGHHMSDHELQDRNLAKANGADQHPEMPRRLTLPPPYSQHRIESGDVLDEAVRLAPEHGAGTLVWRHGGGIVAFAVVLEPEQPLVEARMAFFTGMVALGDALAAHCVPERAVRFGYPDVVVYDEARLGGARFVTAQPCGEDEVPDWMVFAVELIAERDHLAEPGAWPDSTSLREEEFAAAEDIVESFAAYLMLWFDRWTHQGLKSVLDRYLERIAPPMQPGQRWLADGDLVERLASGELRRHTLAEGLAACRWRDATGPKL